MSPRHNEPTLQVRAKREIAGALVFINGMRGAVDSAAHHPHRNVVIAFRRGRRTCGEGWRGPTDPCAASLCTRLCVASVPLGLQLAPSPRAKARGDENPCLSAHALASPPIRA
jgi:hypothetical protein